MGIFDLLPTKALASSEETVMEPFIAPDTSGMSAEDMARETYLSQMRVEHWVRQVLMSMSRNPLFGSMLPKMSDDAVE